MFRSRLKSVARRLPAPVRGVIRRALQVMPLSLSYSPQPKRLTLEKLRAVGDQGVVVFFAPEAGVVPHYIAHCLIAKTLKERGHRVLIIRCFDVYPRCVVMDSVAFALEPSEGQRRSLCGSCLAAANDMAGKYELDVLDLRDLIDDETRREVAELIRDLPEDLSTFEIGVSGSGSFAVPWRR